MSSKFKWVIINHATGMTVHLTKKPKKVPGGYMDIYGKRYIGAAVYLLSADEFKTYYY